MAFELFLDLGKLLSGAQIAVIAEASGFEAMTIAGARLRYSTVDHERRTAVLTFHVLVRTDEGLSPSSATVVVTDAGYHINV